MGRGRKLNVINPFVAEEKQLFKQREQLSKESGADPQTVGLQQMFIDVQLSAATERKHSYNQSVWHMYKTSRKVMKGRKAGRKTRW